MDRGLRQKLFIAKTVSLNVPSLSLFDTSYASLAFGWMVNRLTLAICLRGSV